MFRQLWCFGRVRRLFTRWPPTVQTPVRDTNDISSLSWSLCKESYGSYETFPLELNLFCYTAPVREYRLKKRKTIQKQNISYKIKYKNTQPAWTFVTLLHFVLTGRTLISVRTWSLLLISQSRTTSLTFQDGTSPLAYWRLGVTRHVSVNVWIDNDVWLNGWMEG